LARSPYDRTDLSSPYRATGEVQPPGLDARQPLDDEWMLPAVPLLIALLRIAPWLLGGAPRADAPRVALGIAAICTLALIAHAVRARRRQRTPPTRKDLDAS